MEKSTSEGLPSSKVKIQNRENTLSSTGRLDQVERAEVFGREHLDTAILYQGQRHIDDTKRLTGFLFLFMLCPPLSLLRLWSVESLAGRRVLHHWCKWGLFLCKNKLYQGRAVLSRGITVSPYGLLPIRVQGSWNAKLGPDYFTGGWNSAICHVRYNGTFTVSKCWITALGDAHMRSGPEFGV